MNIAEIITTDGEVFSAEAMQEKKMQMKLIKAIDFSIVEEFYLNKKIIACVLEKEAKSGKTNGATLIDVLECFSWSKIKPFVDNLIEQKYLRKRESINNDVYYSNIKKTIV